MQWMLDIQLGRRNLPPAQRLAVMDKFKRKIQEQAKSTQGTRTDLTSSPNGEKVISTHTDKELAKMAGVGKETSRMGAKVLNSDNENVKLCHQKWSCYFDKHLSIRHDVDLKVAR